MVGIRRGSSSSWNRLHQGLGSGWGCWVGEKEARVLATWSNLVQSSVPRKELIPNGTGRNQALL